MIVIFNWDEISGVGIVRHGTTLHNAKLSPEEIRLEVLDVDPIDNTHPIYNTTIEVGSFTAMPYNKLHPYYVLQTLSEMK